MLMQPQITLPIPEPSLEEILKTLNVFCDPAEVVELRCFAKDKPGIFSGYFDSNHWGDLADEAIRLNRNGLNCYITMNPVDPRLFDRAPNKVVRAVRATQDVSIVKRAWLMLDFDPVRPSGTAATEGQLLLTKEIVFAVHGFLKSCGWPDPIAALSGNGVHLIYRINLPNTTEGQELVRNVLQALAKRFDTFDVKVDRSVYNAARIIKLFGTVSTKGRHTAETPWRLSRIISTSGKFVEVSLEQLRALLPPMERAAAPANNLNNEFEVKASHQGLPSWLLAALKFIDPQPYQEWLTVGMALHDATGGSDEGLKIFIDWSSSASNFDATACHKKWCTFGDRQGQKLTMGSVYHLAKEAGWPGPQAENLKQPQPLPDELLPVAAFDFSLLPDSLRAWAQDICERVQCPPDFVGAGIMASLAAVVGRKIGIRPQDKTDWTVVPNLWALVVGRPGVLKSPALEATLAPLNRLVAKANEDHTGAYNEYKKNLAIAKLRAVAGEKAARNELAKNAGADVSALLAVDEPGEPTLKRYKANDTSPASLGELLRQNPNGLLVYRDELVSLLKGLDREDQAEGRGFYLTAWNGDSSYTFDRIGRGLNLNIEAVCLSILGGTQPGRLSEYIRHAVKGGAADDGLIQRFGLLVWPETGGTWKDVDRWPDTDAKNQAFKVFEYLDKLTPAEIGAGQDTDLEGNPNGIPYLRFDVEGLEMFREWRKDLESHLRGGELSPALESHFAKYRKLIPALALIIHLADKGRGPVSGKATLQALAWSKYLETHARRTYGAISQPSVATAKAILTRVKKGDLPASFSSRDVWRPGWAMLSDREQVIEGLRLLIDYGHLREERNDETGGRPATIFHTIEGGRQ